VYFCHAGDVWTAYPELVPVVLHAARISPHVDVGPRLAALHAVAEARLAAGPESELPEIQAWRRAFARMGLKPTQYRCASESLLRRFRKERAVPRIHPLIDLCNALSLAFAIPIAVFDVSRITGHLEVRYATGAEVYVAFSGEEEHPEPGEVIFADAAGRTHARRWTNRQSRDSAVGDDTTTALIVAEAMHRSAEADTQTLAAAISREIEAAWSIKPTTAFLTRDSPRFDF
jgi:DNA/RNA-binding domain of Phe-tRNA-synthetase-like protein